MFNRPNGLAIHVKSHKRRAAQLQAQAQAEAEAEAEADAAGVNHQRGEYDQEDENPRKRARRAKSEELELRDISRGAEVQMQVQMQNVDTDVQAAGDSNVERLEYHGFHVLPGSSDFSLSLPVPAQFNYSRPRYPSAVCRPCPMRAPPKYLVLIVCFRVWLVVEPAVCDDRH